MQKLQSVRIAFREPWCEVVVPASWRGLRERPYWLNNIDSSRYQGQFTMSRHKVSMINKLKTIGFQRDRGRSRKTRRLFESENFSLPNVTLEIRQMLSGTDPNPPTTWKTDNTWGSGYQAEVTVTNQQPTWIDDFQFQFDLADNITSIWGGRIVSHVGSTYTVAPDSWASRLQAGSKFSLGFVATGSAGPAAGQVQNPLLRWNLDGGIATTPGTDDGSTDNGSPTPTDPPAVTANVAIDYSVTSDWGSGFNGQIKITNTGTANINGWELKFHTSNTLSSVWNGVATGSSGNVTIRNESWNGTLTPGSSVTIGFTASGTSANRPTDYFFNGTAVEVVNDGGSGGGNTGDDGGGTVTPPSTNAPAKPTIRVDAVIGAPAGTYEASFAIWSGTQANRWSLYENDVLIYSGDLETNATGSQTASTQIVRTYGAGQFRVVVENANGTTSSDSLTRVFGGASPIRLNSVDVGSGQAASVVVDQGVSRFSFVNLNAPANSAFEVYTNTPDVVKVSVSSDGQLQVEGLAAGRASVMIRDTSTGEARWLGVTVRNADGTMPGWPDTVALGSVSEDTPSNLAFWRSYENPSQNKQMDIRYIYLNGGPVNGWRSWSATDGDRLVSYLRESQKLGMIPYFVWYNIPDGGESYYTNLQHIQDPAYMKAYFEDLKFALDTINAQAGDWPVGFILEPDFLGYLMQNSGLSPDQISAQTSAVYESGLLDRSVDPDFANHVGGLVQAINYSISKVTPSMRFGWQVNLWASPETPGNGIIRATDSLGWDAGRSAVSNTANAIADYYKSAGILSYGANFVSIDKYGLDAGAQNGAAADPAASTWFWNADHWSNYLLFAKTLHENTGMPITLWQLPVGRINGTTQSNPYDASGTFADLNNTSQHYEDSAPSYFFGDTFQTTDSRAAYFGSNQSGDAGVTVNGNTVTWTSHMRDALDAGITTLLFGAGVGDSTSSVGNPPTDGYWWITKAQEYLANPVPLDPTTPVDPPAPTPTPPPVTNPPVISASSQSVVEGQSGSTNLVYTVNLSAASNSTVTVAYSTSDNTATSGSDYVATRGVLSFAPGETSKTINVPVLGDSVVEDDETFGLSFSDPTNATLGVTSVTGTIVNDDTAQAPQQPSLAIGSTTVTEGNSGTVSLVFQVTLSAASTSPVTVNYSSANGTATAGTDYEATSGTLTFAPGETNQTVSVPVNGDTAVEENETLSLTLSSALGAMIATATGTGTILNDDTYPQPDPNPPAPTPTPASGKQIVGYFAEWGIYGRQYNITDVPADKLTVLNYAFAQIKDGEVAIYDTYAAIEKSFPGDTWDQPIRGNFNQIAKMKAANPNLSVVISVGGWTLSSPFSDVAATEASRQKFAESAVRFVKQYGFDGIDLDWEYPVSGGLETNKTSPADKQNYTLLVQALRAEFNKQEAIDGEDYLITMAVPPGYSTMQNFELPELAQSLDWMNVMAYDYHGAWENTTGHNAPLYANPNSSFPDEAKFNVDYIMQAYVAAGVPKNQLVMGAPMYGRTWQGVQPGPNGDGLFQTATGAGAGTWEKGVIDYADLLNKVQTDPATYQLYRDPSSQVPYVYAPNKDGGWFSSFEDTTSLGTKLDYILANEYAGMMFWELDADVRDASSPDSLLGLAASRLLENQPSLPGISASDVSVMEGNSGTTQATVTISLSKASEQPVTVNYGTFDGTANSGTDYAAATGQLTFAPGETSKTIPLVVYGDTVAETNETFQIRLNNAVGASILKNASTVTVTNDDAPPAPPVSSDTAVLNITGSWLPGFGGEITVKNTTGSAFSSGWILEFDANFEISSLWNAEIVGRVGNRYTVKSLSWNGSLAAGATVKFGINGNLTTAGVSPSISGATIRKA